MHRLQVPPNLITVLANRFRPADEGKVKEIMASFEEYGQLQPIVINEAHELVDGLHRLTAAQRLGLNFVWIDVQNVDEVRAREIELEINIRRLDMSPAERIRATAEIHKLKSAKDPNWTQERTAEFVGGHQHGVSVSVNLAKIMEVFPDVDWESAKSVRQLRSWAEQKSAQVTRVAEVRANPASYADLESKVWLGDSVELIRSVSSESIHAVITDPPFGLAYDSRKAGTSGSLTAYRDDTESYERLLSMAPELFRVIKPNGWLTWFLGISWYERCKQVFREAGFIVDEIPVIWNRSEGRCHTNRPDRYYARSYDIALHCLKGDPQMILRNRPNVITVKPVENHERETLVERPTELYAEIIRRLTVPGEVVADFFVGSGSCLAAAASLGRDFFGCELSPERRAYALKKIKAHMPEDK